MNDLKVRRLTAVFGLAIVALNWAMFPLYLVPGPAPQFQDTARFIAYWTINSSLVLARVLLDLLECACLLVFAAGLRHLIRQARSEYEWASTLVFTVGLAFAILTLLGDALACGAALDTVGGKAEPAVVRALWEGSIPAFGAMGLIIMALFMASVGYTTLVTSALPRWTGWVACAGAIGNLVAVPAIYAGANATGFYTADGLVSLLSELPFLIWALAVSISMFVVRQETKAKTPAYGG